MQQDREGQHCCARHGDGAEPWFSVFGLAVWAEVMGKVGSTVKRKHGLIATLLAGHGSTKALIQGARISKGHLGFSLPPNEEGSLSPRLKGNTSLPSSPKDASDKGTS